MVLGPHVPQLSAMELLLSVAKTGSLNAAAAECSVSQQAASQRIRALEAQTGIALVHRAARGSSLTPSGVVVAQWCAQVIAAARQLETGVAALRDDQVANLRVRSSLTIAEHLLPGWLIQLHDLFPEAKIELRTENSRRVVDDVLSGAANVGFIESPEVSKQVRSKIVGYDELIVVVPPGHPWARRRSPLTPELVARTPLVMREEGSGTRQAFLSAMEQAGYSESAIVAPALELDTATAIRAAVLGGVGPAVLSTRAVADDVLLGRLRAVPLHGVDLTRPLRAIWIGSSRLPVGLARDLVVTATATARRVP